VKSPAATADPPRVLFCTYEIPQSVNAGSMQLYRALLGYPGDRLLVLGHAPEPGAQLLPARYETLRLLTYRLTCTRFRDWATGVNALDLLPEPNLARSVALARPFRPDLVVTVMDKLSFYKHAWALARRLRVPLMTITMDDPQTFERAVPPLEFAFARLLRRIYADAALSLGVSQEMAVYLQEHFGRATEVFHFGPPDNMKPVAPAECGQLKRPGALTLGYAGSMSLGYGAGIRALLPVLEATGTRLVVYTKDRDAVVHPLIENRGFLPVDTLWPAVQRECDAVVLPYSPGADIARVYRTHFPTKLSEYAWLGLPILVTGPAYATGYRWARRHPEAALCASDEAELRAVLETLRQDGARRVQLATEAVRLARAQFDSAKIRTDFVSRLRLAAASRPESLNVKAVAP
jgi:hypothetical protein